MRRLWWGFFLFFFKDRQSKCVFCTGQKTYTVHFQGIESECFIFRWPIFHFHDTDCVINNYLTHIPVSLTNLCIISLQITRT